MSTWAVRDLQAGVQVLETPVKNRCLKNNHNKNVSNGKRAFFEEMGFWRRQICGMESNCV